MTGKILIVDDVATNRIVLKVKLAAARYQTLQAGTGAEAVRQIARETPDLVLLDAKLPDVCGLELCRRIRAVNATADLPIVMTSAQPDPGLRLAALRAGANDLIAKPSADPELYARLRGLLRARADDLDLRLREAAFQDLGFAETPVDFEPPATIALIAGSREGALLWKNALSRQMRGDIVVALQRDEALAVASGRDCPDAFLIPADLGLPGDGLRLMSELRARTGSRHAAICIIVPDGQPEATATAYDLGADDLIPGGVPSMELAAEAVLRLRRQIARKRRSNHQRESLDHGLRLATTDPLTGLHNRRYAMPHLLRIVEEAHRLDQPYAVMALDLDRFKSINDTWGHGAGDTVLVEVARRLRRGLRPTDLLARTGGEEFLIAMPDTTPDEARAAAQRLCLTVRDTVIATPVAQIPVTISIGLTLGRDWAGATGAAQVDALITQADQALLDAKAEGRNRVTLFQQTVA